MIYLKMKGEYVMANFEQIKLKYGAKDYAPVINQETIETHYGKHHKTYTDTLNKLLNDNNIDCSSITELLSNLDRIEDENVRTAIKNNGGGYFNHNLYFETLAPKDTAKHEPEGELLSKINEAFGAFDELKAKLKALALGQFGSGWAFLSVTPDGALVATKSPNQDNPYSEKSGNTPIACIDVWEHAYYLDYKNLRAAYVDALFDIIDWSVVEKKYEEAK